MSREIAESFAVFSPFFLVETKRGLLHSEAKSTRVEILKESYQPPLYFSPNYSKQEVILVFTCVTPMAHEVF